MEEKIILKDIITRLKSEKISPSEALNELAVLKITKTEMNKVFLSPVPLLGEPYKTSYLMEILYENLYGKDN